MSRLLSRMWQAGEAATHVHSVVSLAGIVLGAFGALVAAMTAVLRSMPDLLPWHGWGVYVLLAIAIVLAILIALVAVFGVWVLFYGAYRKRRYPELFREARDSIVPEGPITPIAELSEASKIDKVEKELAQSVHTLDQQDTMLHREVDAARSSLHQEIEAAPLQVDQRIKELVCKIDTHAADIARFNDLGVTHNQFNEFIRGKLKSLESMLKALTERQSTHERVVASGTHLLIRGIRAREAKRYVLTPNDEIAMRLGKPLVEAVSYPDAASWVADFQKWNAAVQAIDNLMVKWTKGSSYEYKSLFDLKGYHYKQAPMPPDNIRADDIIDDYRTVWQVQSSYRNQREDFFSFFEENEVLPG